MTPRDTLRQLTLWLAGSPLARPQTTPETKIPVLIDGGFRRGTDILKALAIGARAVLVGRPPLWELGAFGDAGVRRVMEILRRELAWAMGLAGCPTIASIDPSLVKIEK